MPDVVRALIRQEEAGRGGHQLTHVIERAWTKRAEERLEFREGLFDGIEIGTVGREESQPGSRLLNRRAYLGLLVRREIVQHDDITRTERGHQDLLDVGAKRGGVDRPIEHGRRGQLGGTERRDDGVRLPMAARRVIPDARPARAARVAA